MPIGILIISIYELLMAGVILYVLVKEIGYDFFYKGMKESLQKKIKNN